MNVLPAATSQLGLLRLASVHSFLQFSRELGRTRWHLLSPVFFRSGAGLPPSWEHSNMGCATTQDKFDQIGFQFSIAPLVRAHFRQSSCISHTVVLSSSTLQHMLQLEELSLEGVKAFPPHPSLHVGRAGRKGWWELSHAVLVAFLRASASQCTHFGGKSRCHLGSAYWNSLYFQPWELSLGLNSAAFHQ